MYDLTEFGTDDKLWQLIALCAGTGGSILVIGSARYEVIDRELIV